MFNQSHKKLQIWQKAMKVTKSAYEITKAFPKEELYGLTSQIRRAAVSVPSNIAEGSQRKSDKEFANFILISKGSLLEMETQFLLAKEFNYLNETKLERLMIIINELDKMLFWFHKSLTASS